jgi:hypothetical protein
MGGKMSSSDPDSKIDFLDPPEAVKRKIKKAFCEEGNITENGLLAFTKAVLIPISQLRIERRKGETGLDSEEGQGAIGQQNPFVDDDAPEGTVYTIRREGKFGGPPSHYKDYLELEEEFAAKKVHPSDLKASVNKAIDSLLEPILKAFTDSPEWQQVEKLAYPDPKAKAGTKKKKVGYLIFCLFLSFFFFSSLFPTSVLWGNIPYVGQGLYSLWPRCPTAPLVGVVTSSASTLVLSISARKRCTIRHHQGGAGTHRRLKSLPNRVNHRHPPAKILNRVLPASSSMILISHACKKHNA